MKEIHEKGICHLCKNNRYLLWETNTGKKICTDCYNQLQNE